MRHRAIALSLVALFLGAVGNTRADEPDSTFDVSVASPAYTTRHPTVLFDGAHFNFMSIGGNYKRYKPFGDLIVNDGYRVTLGRQKFTNAVLTPYQVLVIAGAMGGPSRLQPDAANPAFTPEECTAVRDWVMTGGSLLLITDHHPFGLAARDLARKLGVEMSNGTVSDPINADADNTSFLMFTRENGLLVDHPITQGRDESEKLGHIVSFVGQSLKGPPSAVPFLKLGDTAVDKAIDGVAGKQAAAKGRAQGLAFNLGKGRVVVLGDNSMLTALTFGDAAKPQGMNVPGNDDRQLALNIMHWLSKLSTTPTPTPAPIAIAATPAPAPVAVKPVAAPAPATAAPASATAAPAPVAAKPHEPGKTLSTADIAEESEDSIGLVKGKGSVGTGFLVAPGILATNSHVIDDEFVSDLEVAFTSADEAQKGPFPVELLYEDPKRDLALLSIKTDLPPLRVAEAYNFRKGEDITVIGNPGLGGDVVLENAISRGVMSTKMTLEGQSFYQLGISVNPGNSGGPVFDSQGQVIGVVTLKSSKEALAFCVPVEDLNAAIKKQASQPTAEMTRIRSQHRAIVSVKSLGPVGAIYSVAIDLRRAVASPAGKSPDVKAAAQKLDEIVASINKDALPIIGPQVASTRKDSGLAPSVREKIGKLADSFNALKTAYETKPTGLSKDALLQMKSNHRQLMTDLYSKFNIPLPTQMMTAFEDHPVPQMTVVAQIAPRPQSSLRQRIDERKGTSRGTSLRDRNRAGSRLRNGR